MLPVRIAMSRSVSTGMTALRLTVVHFYGAPFGK